MDPAGLLAQARQDAGLTQDRVASRARTSRPTLSVYEHGHKSPTLATAARVLAASGHQLQAVPRVKFREVRTARSRTLDIPGALPRLPIRQALATVVLPLHLNWTEPGRQVDLADRRQRTRAYEVVLREGRAIDIGRYVDGALLVDLWDEPVFPRDGAAGSTRPRSRVERVARNPYGSDSAARSCGCAQYPRPT